MLTPADATRRRLRTGTIRTGFAWRLSSVPFASYAPWRPRVLDRRPARYRAPAVGRSRVPGRAVRGWRGEGSAAALAVPLAFQIGVLPAAALVYVGGSGTAGSRPVLALTAMLTAATAVLGLGVWRGMAARTVLLGDSALAVAGNLALSAWSSPSDRAVEVSWQYFAGCVALWTVARGVPGGLAAAAAGIPVRLAMVAAAGPVRTGRSAAVSGLGDAAVLLVAVLVTGALLIVADRDAERLRTGIRRSLHDTVLQTLEAIALTLPNDAEHAQRRLREVRAVAHAEAVALRRQLSRPAGAGGTPGLIEGLVGVFAELARDGLRVRLDAVDSSVAYHARRPDGERDGVTARRRAALLAATREALRNVLKHSGVAEALLRVEADADGAAAGVPGLTVTVRDFGVGFDPAVHRPGFGLSESVTARMAEVGGTATVRARPGHGTAVVLWVPAAGSAGGRAVRPAGPNLSQDPDPF